MQRIQYRQKAAAKRFRNWIGLVVWLCSASVIIYHCYDDADDDDDSHNDLNGAISGILFKYLPLFGSSVIIIYVCASHIDKYHIIFSPHYFSYHFNINICQKTNAVCLNEANKKNVLICHDMDHRIYWSNRQRYSLYALTVWLKQCSCQQKQQHHQHQHIMSRSKQTMTMASH